VDEIARSIPDFIVPRTFIRTFGTRDLCRSEEGPSLATMGWDLVAKGAIR